MHCKTKTVLEALPLTGITSAVGILLVIVFFVTSSDSGSLVVDSLTSGGKLDSPVPQRIFWAVMEGVVAAVLLLGGGLSALQTASITTGLPFTVILLVMCYSIYKALSYEQAVVIEGRKLMKLLRPTTPETRSTPEEKQDLLRVVDLIKHAMEDDVLTQEEQEQIVDAIMSDGKITESEAALIRRVQNRIWQGRLKMGD